MPIKKRSSIPVTEATDHTYDEDIQGGRHPMLQGQYLDVYQFIEMNPNCTREDVTRGTGIKSSTATARVKELIDEGFIVEPPGVRKTNRSGVRARVLHISERAQGGQPLDKVRIQVELTIDRNGNYGAHAFVIGGDTQDASTIPIKKTRITMTAPHPDSYRSSFDEAELARVSRHETQTYADDIIDVDYVVVDNT